MTDTALRPSTGREPINTRPRHQRSWKRRLAMVAAIAGPGLIAANAGNDAGGIATYASAGAEFGYRTLFLMVLVTVALVLVQEMCARLAAYTGKGLAALIREQFSIRLTGFALSVLVIANFGLVVSEFAGVAAALELLGVSRFISVPLAAVGVWSLVVFGSYRYAERAFVAMTVGFFAYPIAAVLAHPHWGEAGKQLVLPHFLAHTSFVTLAVALVGTTITPYMQFYLSGAIADRAIGPNEYRHERLDTIAGSIFCNLISMAIIIATAAAITKRAPLSSAAEAATALEPVAGSFAKELFAFGLLGASLLAAAVVPLSSSYAIAEAVGAERSVSRSFKQAPLFLGPVQRTDPHRCRTGPHPRRPNQPSHQSPSPQRTHHPDPAHLRPHPRQPPFGPRQRRQQPHVPDRGDDLCRRRRPPLRPRPHPNPHPRHRPVAAPRPAIGPTSGDYPTPRTSPPIPCSAQAIPNRAHSSPKTPPPS